MFRYAMALILSNSIMRGCFTFLAGMALIVAGFYISSLGIRGVIRGDFSLLYVAALCLIFIIVLLFGLLWALQRRGSFQGGPMVMPPPQNFKEDAFFERDDL
jgi:hypothetical protein